MIDNKQMKGKLQVPISDNTMTCQWMDDSSVLLLSSALEGMNDIL